MTQFPEKTGVLLVNTGSPASPDADSVRDYLRVFLSNKRIVPMNKVLWWLILRAFILPRRTDASAAKYRKIWAEEGSPLLALTASLASRLQASCRADGVDVTVKMAMSFGEPTIDDALEAFYEEGINRIAVVPMYPQSAYSTVKVVEDAVRAKLKAMSWRPYLRYVSGYSDHPLYAKAIAQSILKAGFVPDSTDKLILSFHSIPLADIEHGDTYELQVGSSCLAITSLLGIDRRQWTIGYQSRFDKSRAWLSPLTGAVLEREAQLPRHRVFLVCPNFSVDCLETLYDIEYRFRPVFMNQLMKNGIKTDDESLIYIPCLNDSDAQVRLIREVVRRSIM